MHEDGLVLLGELTLVLVGKLDQAEVPPVPPDQRGGEPAPHRRVFGSVPAEPFVAGVLLQLGLRHAQRAVRAADQRVDARAVRPLVVAPPAGVLLGQRHGVDRLPPILVGRETRDRLVRPDQGAGLLGDDAGDRGDIGGGVQPGGDLGQSAKLLRPEAGRRLGPLPVGDVGEQDADLSTARPAHPVSVHVVPPAHRLRLVHEPGRLAGRRHPPVNLEPVGVVVRDQLPDRPAHGVLEPGVLLERRIRLQEAVVGGPVVGVVQHLHDAERLVHRLEQGAEPLLARPNFCLGPLLLADVPKHQHAADDFAVLSPNRGGTVVDGPLRAVLGDEDGMVRQPDHPPFPQDLADRVLDRRACMLVDDLENDLQRSSHRLVLRPAGQRLGDGVQERDPPLGVGREDRIPDAGEGDAQPLPLFLRLFLGPPPLDDDGGLVGPHAEQQPVLFGGEVGATGSRRREPRGRRRCRSG